MDVPRGERGKRRGGSGGECDGGGLGDLSDCAVLYAGDCAGYEDFDELRCALFLSLIFGLG